MTIKANYSTAIATVYNDARTPFNIRLVRKGDAYGLNLGLVHDQDEPLVEVFDARYVFEGDTGDTLGQFVSRYFLTTFFEGRNGVNLDGGIPAWYLCANSHNLAKVIIRNWVE